ncbi:MAG: hypothetical protein H7Z15_01435 [Rhizobacter sp.]|nr:hypothetical protein [Rhizobacter sp.]
MTTLFAPVKTPLGQDELRHRTRGLGQRYRTVLLLVDGRRPLGEVLGMAHKAGAQTSHFEELVRMGLVEIPDDMAAPEPIETIPGALDTPKLTSVELDVLIEPALTPSRALAEEAEVDGDGFGDEPVTKVAEVKISPAHHLPVIAVATIPVPTPPPVAAPRPAALPRYQEPEVVLSETPRVPDWVQQVRETPFKVADHARPAPSMTEEQRLQYVRDLLLDTLRRDSLLFSTFAVGRVRVATTHKELIKLVWEIERDRAHPRRSRDQLLNLQRARELLGMGNTLVAGDSQPGPSSEY